MAYGCSCGGKFEVVVSPGHLITRYVCKKCRHSVHGAMLPQDYRQAGRWMGRKSILKIGRLVKLGHSNPFAITVKDGKGRELVTFTPGAIVYAATA